MFKVKMKNNHNYGIPNKTQFFMKVLISQNVSTVG